MNPKDAAMRKRTQISHTSRNMFLWVVIASVIVSFAIVASVFLTRKLIFNGKVIGEKNKTVDVLKENNKAIPKLQEEVRILDTNEQLAKNKANESDQVIQVILDALPSDANSLALGASLQNKLLVGIDGLTLTGMQVNAVSGVEDSSDIATEDSEGSTQGAITFSFTVKGSQNALKQVLLNLERSIRTIDITNLQVENQSGEQVMTVTARAFYEPAREVILQDKVIKP